MYCNVNFDWTSYTKCVCKTSSPIKFIIPILQNKCETSLESFHAHLPPSRAVTFINTIFLCFSTLHKDKLRNFWRPLLWYSWFIAASNEHVSPADDATELFIRFPPIYCTGEAEQVFAIDYYLFYCFFECECMLDCLRNIFDYCYSNNIR